MATVQKHYVRFGKITVSFFWAGILLWIVELSYAAVFTYTNEVRYLNALAAFGYSSFQEGFEDDAIWGSVRTTIPGGPQTAKSITSLGITWTANNDNGEVTTGNGPARRGQWGFFCLPHGDFPNGITDGFIGTSAATLFGFGGWVETNTPPAAINIIIDDIKVIDFEDVPLDTRHRFFGVIDTNGFTKFEIRELEGTLGDQKFIFADDFTFGKSILEAPLERFSIMKGVLLGGDLSSLEASDDDYLLLDAELNQSQKIYSMNMLVIAISPETVISKLDMTLELAADSENVLAAIRLRNFDTDKWDTLEIFNLNQSDTQKVFLDIPNPNTYIRDIGGHILVQIVSWAKAQQIPDGYTVRLDLVRLEVAP
ncbi:hypothetical protein H8E77_18735 [bacterium]|nr:hypothetical protein [bacterium]